MIGLIEELPNGVRLHQATEEEADKCNLYCEYPWCPPASHCFVYGRYAPEQAPNSQELIACDFGTWEKRRIGFSSGGATMANGRLYFKRFNEQGRSEFVRYHLETNQAEVIELPEGLPRSASFAVSRDERYLAFSQSLSFDPQLFGVGLVDLQTGEWGILHEDPWICNPHLQFEPSGGRQLLVQHNRGCRFTPIGQMELLCGPEGCTLFVLEIPSGTVIRLPVGPPYTASLSGHEAWLGDTGEIIATLNYSEDYDYGKGRIIGIRPGGPYREICVPWELNHIGAEPSGCLFAGDAYRPDEIVIGSPHTHKAAVVCASQATYNRAKRRTGRPGLVYDSHPHPYLSPDRRWVVFNSDRTGIQQIYVAEIPVEMSTHLESE